MDEFHYYADPDRGWAWQVPLIELPKAQFILMSATLGDVTRFQEDLTRRTGWQTAVVKNAERPVPLVFSYSLEPLHETLQELLTTNQAPVYVVHFTQAAALEQAQALMSTNMCTRQEKDAIAEMIGDFRFASGFGKTLSRLVQARHRRPPRGHAAQVPPARRDARPGGPAQGHLRHRHARRRHQRADPHGGLHGPVQVRRQEDPAAPGARVPPDRRPGRAGGLRHRRTRRRAGARARHREREVLCQGPRQGRRRPPGRAGGSSRRSRPRAWSPGASPPSSASSPPSPSR